MYCVVSFENMSTKADRRGWNDVRVNGLVSFFLFEAPISISVKQG
jgi:hypothetical protein